jgi:hypothetical protein
MFDWSALPADIKRIIFYFCKLDQQCQTRLELKKIRKWMLKTKFDEVLNELKVLQNKKRNKNKLKYINRENKLFFSDTHNHNYYSQIGINLKHNDMNYRINNFCYLCQKNSNVVHSNPVDFEWFNLKKRKIIKNTLYICYNCYHIFDCLDYIDEVSEGYTLTDAISNLYEINSVVLDGFG